jgi:hypothetical protein
VAVVLLAAECLGLRWQMGHHCQRCHSRSLHKGSARLTVGGEGDKSKCQFNMSEDRQ